jgi:uncharacterized membrane protein YqgA involved in biofilm formation
MKMNLHLWQQRHPDAVRNLLVGVLGLFSALIGIFLYQTESDPWIIVALVVAYAIIARWILEQTGFMQLLHEVAQAVWWLLKAAMVIGIAVWMFIKIPTWQ